MTRQYALTTIEAFADKDWFNMHSYNELRAMFKVVRSAYKRYPKLSSNIGKQRLVYWLLTLLGHHATYPCVESDSKYFGILSHSQQISVLTYWLQNKFITDLDYSMGILAPDAACNVRNKYYRASAGIVNGEAAIASGALDKALMNGFATQMLPKHLKQYIDDCIYKTYWAEYAQGMTDYIHPSIGYRITVLSEDAPHDVASTLAYLRVLNVLTPEEYDCCSTYLSRDTNRSGIKSIVTRAINRTRAYLND